MKDKKQLKVDPIKNGTVIDHISAGKALQVADILNLKQAKDLMLIGVNLSSRKMEKKDIIKIENRKLTTDEVNSIALISPNATLTIIEDYRVVKKEKITLPKEIKQHIICPNPNCVTNIEQVETKFEIAGDNPVAVRCEYCEKKYSIENVKFRF
jgi:aspartate carbamoyltransferase regulatory subunit